MITINTMLTTIAGIMMILMGITCCLLTVMELIFDFSHGKIKEAFLSIGYITFTGMLCYMVMLLSELGSSFSLPVIILSILLIVVLENAVSKVDSQSLHFRMISIVIILFNVILFMAVNNPYDFLEIFL